MKKLILFLLIMATSAVAAPTYKVCYIMAGADTTVRNANIDSLRYDIVNDPQGQLPGTWTMDIITRASAEGQSSSFWANYDLIVCWGTEENSGASDFRSSINDILDTIHKPVIMRDAFAAYGDPMFLGTAARAVETMWMKMGDRAEFIGRKTYTDNFNYGDSLRLFTSSLRATHAIRGMANDVKTIVRHESDKINTDADTALVAILYAGGTNASGGTAPAKRAYFGLVPSWRYASWSARDMWYRTLRWAVGDTVIDTCVTQIRVTREGVDGNWMEYSGIACQMSWHYGGYGTLYTGYDIFDRVSMIRARTRAITTQLPDTSASYAYDIGNVSLTTRINGIAENNPANSFNFWLGLFRLDYDTLWLDYKTSIQLDSTCGSWSSGEYHALPNSNYLKYPTIPWNSARANTRGTDYFTNAYDSIYLQDPITEQYVTFDGLDTAFAYWRDDSTTNQGVITHTCGTPVGDAEIQLYSENNSASFQSVRSGPQFIVPLVWRAANTGAADLDSSILIQDPFGNDSMEFNVFVNGALPTTQTFVISNGSSSASFDCATTEESPAVDWATVTTINGGTTTYYAIIGVDQTGLAAGYYYTWIKATCASVPDSPDSAKVVLRVEDTSVREATGPVKIR